ncbi:TetR/AcrR family transcriptional regulator [Streptomyces sp. NRRL F-5727]|uniref:TetR/AcrR family transcriptional regulator n=1 Tax=Streptomyces sp. NRRL F-5727 TaxID=1463871 RepID=UPI00068A13E9|nr:TetR family transcriptional regulator [Streptomyces sp. NRRL F-5727]
MARPRRYDPGRRERIVDAALRVARRDGIGGLSHRTVAAEADVPLGSTTYHFGSLDELLVAALRKVNAGFAEQLRSRPVRDGDTLADGLARLLGGWLGAERSQVELEYELYLAALRRPALRPVAAEWAEEVVTVLAPHTGRATARALVALMDGIGLQVLLTGAPYDEAYAREMIARILNEAPKDQAGGLSEAPAGPTGT